MRNRCGGVPDRSAFDLETVAVNPDVTPVAASFHSSMEWMSPNALASTNAVRRFNHTALAVRPGRSMTAPPVRPELQAERVRFGVAAATGKHPSAFLKPGKRQQGKTGR